MRRKIKKCDEDLNEDDEFDDSDNSSNKKLKKRDLNLYGDDSANISEKLITTKETMITKMLFMKELESPKLSYYNCTCDTSSGGKCQIPEAVISYFENRDSLITCLRTGRLILISLLYL